MINNKITINTGENHNVPRTVHVTWKNLNIPFVWQKSITAWKELVPTFTVRMWTDENLRTLIDVDFHWFLEIYDALPYHIQRVDVARSFILYKFGGVYADMDMCVKDGPTFEALVNLFEKSPYTVGLVETSNAVGKFKLSNYLMFAKPGAIFWKHYWEFVADKNWKNRYCIFSQSVTGLKHFNVMFRSGPTALSMVALEYSEKVFTIPSSLTSGTHTNSTFEHLRGESWCDNSTQFAHILFSLNRDKSNIAFTCLFGAIVLIVILSMITRNKQ
jgi:mannosyltransferase OCH1-like enzyme